MRQWHIDSGAGRTITWEKAFFRTIAPLHTRTLVRFAGGDLAEATGVGTIPLRVPQLPGVIMLYDCLFVPKARVNLIGVLVVVQSELGCEFRFGRTGCRIVRGGPATGEEVLLCICYSPGVAK